MAQKRLPVRHGWGIVIQSTALEGQAGWGAGREVRRASSREITVALTFGYSGLAQRVARKPSMQSPAFGRSWAVCGSARLFTHPVHRRGQTHIASRLSLTLRVDSISFCAAKTSGGLLYNTLQCILSA